MNKYIQLEEAIAAVINDKGTWQEKAQAVIDECGSWLDEFLDWFEIDGDGEVRVASS